MLSILRAAFYGPHSAGRRQRKQAADLRLRETFRAWNQTSGAAGLNAGVSVNGGMTAYRSDTAIAGITVAPVNDTPAAITQSVTVNEGPVRKSGRAGALTPC